jgi:hypothetical protein
MAGKTKYPRTYLDHNLIGDQRRPITDSDDTTRPNHFHGYNKSIYAPPDN